LEHRILSARAPADILRRPEASWSYRPKAVLQLSEIADLKQSFPGPKPQTEVARRLFQPIDCRVRKAYRAEPPDLLLAYLNATLTFLVLAG